jgi:hypothetical protein
MSPLRIVIEFRDSFDPPQGLFLILLVETSDLAGNPAPNGLRTSIRYNQPQLAQTTRAPALSHCSHPFGRFRHAVLLAH